MLAQFQNHYPNGSLISELLTIYQGKFVVRVSVQVEGVLRATGMSVSESLELAEDQARSRAIMVLGIQPATAINEDQTMHQEPRLAAGDRMSLQSELDRTAEDSHSSSLHKQNSPAGKSELNNSDEPSYPISSAPLPKELNPTALTQDSDSFFVANPSTQESDVTAKNLEIWPEQTPSSGHQKFSFGNVTPLVPRNYSQDTESFLPRESESAEINDPEPVDISDLIARTSIEMERLKWNNQKGRQHLLKTYNKRSRQELSAEEMLEFLHYLESQSSP